MKTAAALQRSPTVAEPAKARAARKPFFEGAVATLEAKRTSRPLELLDGGALATKPPPAAAEERAGQDQSAPQGVPETEPAPPALVVEPLVEDAEAVLSEDAVEAVDEVGAEAIAPAAAVDVLPAPPDPGLETEAAEAATDAAAMVEADAGATEPETLDVAPEPVMEPAPVLVDSEAAPAPVEAVAPSVDPDVAMVDPAVVQPDLEPLLAPPPAVELSLPPPADAGPAEQVATVPRVDLSGGSDQAVVSFIDAGPSAMAASQAEFGQAIDGKMRSEQQALAADPPRLEIKTSGEADVALAGAEAIPVPPEATIGDGVTGADPGRLGQAALPQPAPFRGNAERNGPLEGEEAEAPDDAFRSFMDDFAGGIRTRDDQIETAITDRPKLSMAGEADPSRMDAQRDEGLDAVRAERDANTEAFRNHPGQSNIRPRVIDARQAAAVALEPAVAIEGQDDPAVRGYAQAPLPADVRAVTDRKIAAKLAANLAQAREQATAAASKRDADKGREIDTARQSAAALGTETDAAQRRLVIENRGKVAQLQGEGVATAHDNMNAFAREAANEQTSQRKAIGDHVAAEQGKASEALAKGERDAEAKKLQGEQEAAAKKAELERERKKGSWWQRAKRAIKSAVKAITSAIDAVFTKVRNAIKSAIEAVKNVAIGLINAARNWVVDKLNKFRDWAKSQVNKYLKDAFPNLARRINAGIDAVADQAIKSVNAVADGAIKAVTALADGLTAVLDKIMSTFQTLLKTGVRVIGAVLQGDFAEALRAAIEGACEIAGVDPKTVFDFLDRAGKAIAAILAHPVDFIRDLFGAVGTGISNFAKNIKEHLIEGVVGWLTGALPEINLNGPFEFTGKGVLKITLEVLGITYDNIKARVIHRAPGLAKVFDAVEQGVPLLARLATEGPAALWDEVQATLSNLKDTVLESIRGWLITKVIEGGITWLLSLTNPASAIIKAVKLLYDLVKFLIERYQQIKDFILSVYDAVVEIASGNFAKVATAVENSLAKVLPVLISLLATILNLGGIAAQVKTIIQSITKPINAAIDKVVDKIIKVAQSMLAKGKAGVAAVKARAGEVVDKVKNFLWPKKKFTVDGESHTIYFQQVAGRNAAFIRSNPTELAAFVAAWEANAGPTLTPAKTKHLAAAKATIGEITTLSGEITALETAHKDVPPDKLQDMLALQTALCVSLSGLLGSQDALAQTIERYKLEGLAGTYGTVPKPTGDNLTGDHQPQAASIKYLASRPYFAAAPEGARMVHRASGGHADNAYVINLQTARHIGGRTYGSKGKATKNDFEVRVLAMEAAETKPDKRRTKAVDFLKTELAADVTAIRAVYDRPETDDVWKDLDTFAAGNAKTKTKLVDQIRDQVMRGEKVLAAQPMDELAG